MWHIGTANSKQLKQNENYIFIKHQFQFELLSDVLNKALWDDDYILPSQK
jgi:hypothetical protein